VEFSLAGGAGGSITTVADLDAYLGAVAAAGFTAVSLDTAKLAAAGEGPAALRGVSTMVADHGLRCSDVIALRVSRDDAATLDAARGLAEAAGALGAGFVLTLLGTRLSDESIDRLDRCADIVSAAGAALALEFVPGGPIDRIATAVSLAEQIGVARAGVLIDSWHFFNGASEWEELETVPLDRVALVQFDDALAPIGEDVMTETMDRRTWPGEGVFDLHRFASCLTGRGFNGLVSVEVLSAEHRRLDAATFARRAFETTRPYWS
jgi:sugar phosphate isomerase/epimerase